jgi:signal transduction histidine kinase
MHFPNPCFMKKGALLLALLMAPFLAAAQDVNQLIDGLKAELSSKPDAKRTATIYSDLTWYYTNVAIDSSLHYGAKAIAASRKLGDSTLLAQVYSDVAAAYFRKGDFESSKSNYLTAYKIRKARKDYPGLAKININLGSIYGSRQQYQSAVKAYLDAIEYFEKTGGNELIVNVTKENLGYIFREMKNYPKAIAYIAQGIKYEEQNKLTDRLCISCLNMGNVYLEMKDTLKAMQYYDKSMAACRKTGDKKALQSLHNNIGNIKAGQKKNAEALQLYAESQQEREQFNSDLDKASLKISQAKLLINTGKYHEANQMLLDIKKVFEQQESRGDLLYVYNLLVPVYARLNQPDSTILYANKYAELKEQLLNDNALKQTAELEAKYQTAKKEKLLLEKEAESRAKTNLIVAIATLAFFIALVGLLIYRQQRIKNRQQQQEFQLKSAIAQIETQNQLQEQRLAISRDLHDNIGAQLTFIISSVDNIKYAFDIGNAKLDNKLQSISHFTQATIVELRDTIWAMNSNEITFEDLRARVLNFIEKAKDAREEIDFRFTIDEQLGGLKLSSVSGMNIYRTIQEAVNNAIKYAEATAISIDVKLNEDRIAIDITDNGIGFDLDKIEKGNGLINMEKRIEDLGGIFSLRSEYKKGTTILLLLPNHA